MRSSWGKRSESRLTRTPALIERTGTATGFAGGLAIRLWAGVAPDRAPRIFTWSMTIARYHRLAWCAHTRRRPRRIAMTSATRRARRETD